MNGAKHPRTDLARFKKNTRPNVAFAAWIFDSEFCDPLTARNFSIAVRKAKRRRDEGRRRFTTSGVGCHHRRRLWFRRGSGVESAFHPFETANARRCRESC